MKLQSRFAPLPLTYLYPSCRLSIIRSPLGLSFLSFISYPLCVIRNSSSFLRCPSTMYPSLCPSSVIMCPLFSTASRCNFLLSLVYVINHPLHFCHLSVVPYPLPYVRCPLSFTRCKLIISPLPVYTVSFVLYPMSFITRILCWLYHTTIRFSNSHGSRLVFYVLFFCNENMKICPSRMILLLLIVVLFSSY